MGYQMYDHDKIYYELLDSIESDYNAGNITKEERDIMIAKATLEESDLRKKDIEIANLMFKDETPRENDTTYYQQKINDYLDEKYISCKCTYEELREVFFGNYKYIILNSKHDGAKFNEMCKKIYNDLITERLDIFNISKEDLLRMYDI